MIDIAPVTVSFNTDNVFASLQYLDGEELDMLDGWGIHLAELEKKMPNRLIVALTYFEMRRQHPDLTYEAARKLIRVELNNPSRNGNGSEAPAVVDPTEDNGLDS